jgi:hypothetical protein
LCSKYRKTALHLRNLCLFCIDNGDEDDDESIGGPVEEDEVPNVSSEDSDTEVCLFSNISCYQALFKSRN